MLHEATIDTHAMLAMMSSAQLLAAGGGDMKERRQKIRERLAECERAEECIRELTAYGDELEKQLDQAAAEHVAAAQGLQERLAKGVSPEKRIAIRQELATLNSALQLRCDDLNQRLETVAQEIATEKEKLYARPVLERALMSTGDPRLTLELRVAERSLAIARERLKEATKDLAEFEADWNYTQRRAMETAENEWISHKVKKPDAAPPSGDHYDYLKLESTTAAQIGAQAAREVDELRRAIREG